MAAITMKMWMLLLFWCWHILE